MNYILNKTYVKLKDLRLTDALSHSELPEACTLRPATVTGTTNGKRINFLIRYLSKANYVVCVRIIKTV